MNNNFISLLGYAIGVLGAVAILFSRVKNENLKDLRDRVEILEKELAYSREALVKERKQAQDQHLANREAIARLEKEVSIYKDLQLSSIADSNKQILDTLRGSAIILAKDTKEVAIAVEHVKTDLEDNNPLLVKAGK